MTQLALTREGMPVDAGLMPIHVWDALRQSTTLGDFQMTCCQAPAVLKTSINGLPFFAHLSDECATAPETVWHKSGKAAVLAGLASLGITGREEAPGQSVAGDRWEADVLFSASGRTIAIELQRSYQHFRDFIVRQERYAASSVECFWLLRQETFTTLAKATSQVYLKRYCGSKFPPGGIGTGSLPELPVGILMGDAPQRVAFGGGKAATVPEWLVGIVRGDYQFRSGFWNLG